jgi:hypothetical protein
MQSPAGSLTAPATESETPRTTHRQAARPAIGARFLADYMAAGARERARRTLLQSVKYRVAARMIQHVPAKSAVARFLASPERDIGTLLAQAAELRGRNVADQFAADLNRHNAEYLERFAAAYPSLALPDATISLGPKPPAVTLAGVRVTLDMPLRLRRLARTGRPRIGGAALRYAKGRALPQETGEWQAAFLFGYLGLTEPEDGAAPEHQLCLVIDAQAGQAIPAPGNAIARFREMEAACASIAERWENIEPPTGAVIEPPAEAERSKTEPQP